MIKKITKDDVNDIIQLYNSGWNKTQIAKKYNVSITTIYRKLIENNINTNNKFTKEIQTQICERYKELGSISSVGKEFSIEPCFIINILKANNQQILSNEESHRKYTLNEYYFENINTPTKAYILGLLYADGCVCQSNNGIYLGLEKEDKYLLEQINIELNNSKPLEFIQRSKRNKAWKDMYRIVLYSEIMQQDLIKHGMNYRKSWNLKFPYWLNENLYSHFCRGYFDGDGSVFQSTNTRGGKTTSVDFAGTQEVCKGIQDVLNQNSIYSAIYDSAAHNGITKDLHIIRKNDIQKLFEWLYKDKTLYMERKYNRFISYLNINNSLSA